jgi:hypothetical protein
MPDMKPPRLSVLLLLLATLSGGFSCNEPPLYERRAREFLQKQGTPSDIIDKLTKREPLEPAVAEQLSRYGNVAVLHLIGENPGTPLTIIDTLSRHNNFEVRSGVAINPNASLDLLLHLRTPGKYTTVNGMLARNPRLPQTVLWEMHRNGEASLMSLGLNPNCPPELMREIAAKGDEIDRAWLATNPNLPEDVAQRLAQDKSQLVRNYFEMNPKYGRRGTEPSR